jgi:hypothetical protein
MGNLSIAGALVDILINHLLNMNLERYCYANMFGQMHGAVPPPLPHVSAWHGA